jgi:hypothetical protein
MRIAIIEGTEVINVIVGDKVPKDGIECEEVVCVGWTYLDGEFIAPEPVYEEVDDSQTM